MGREFRSSHIPFVDVRNDVVENPVPGVRIIARSDPAWRGVYVELGESRSWAVDDFSLPDADYLAVNLSVEPLPLEARTPVGFRRRVQVPRNIWIQARGEPFSVRFGHSFYAGIAIDRSVSERYFGRPVELRTRLITHEDERISDLASRVIACATRAGAWERDEAASDLLDHLDAAYSTRPLSIGRSKLSVRQLSAVEDLVESVLEEPLPLERLAGVAGLSPFHFARQFRALTGVTPHAFVLRRRLQRAVRLLRQGTVAADVASACGFTDQSHLTRVMRTKLGVTPRSVVREAVRARI